MVFFAIYILLFAAMLFLSFMDKNNEDVEKEIYWVVGFVLFCLAAFKPVGIDNDALAYIASYYGQSATGLDESMEKSFRVICELIRYTVDVPEVMFFIYALLGVPLKMYSIKRLTPMWFPTLALFISRYYLIEDVTQIRASVVFAMYFFALYYLADGKRWLYVAIVLASSIFHVSALVLLPVAVLSNKPMGMKMRIAVALVPVVGFILYFIKFDILVASFIPYVQDKIELYEKMRDSGHFLEEANVFDKMFLLQLLIFYFLLLKYEVISENYKYTSIMLKLYSLFFAIYCSFAFLPVLAGRLSEFFGIIHIFLIPCIVYTVKPVWVGRATVCLVAIGFLYFSISYMHLLNLDT